ncbi:hypothetical protein [Aeromonas veronii]|uniref:hypothetical protein n=1 Tax=Aeromonas veronii TaxID=654 RepID=UPI00195F8708|nr:hypothetical protein [Aeromonas veronii]
MMRWVYRLEQVGIPPPPQAIPGRQKAPKQNAKRPPSQPMLPLLSADGSPVGKRHFVDSLVPVNIDQIGTIRCATTGRTLWIAPGSPTDRANSGAAERLNPNYRPAVHQVVAGHCQIWKPPPNHLK